MDKPLSDQLVEVDFEQVRRGYDPIAVTSFLAKLSEQARRLEGEVANANARFNALERRMQDSDTNKHSVSAAFVAAADAKQALLADAERKATRILDKARDQAARLSGPHDDLEQSRSEIADLMMTAKRRLDNAETEAAQIISDAKEEADALTSRTRTDALSAVTESKREAERLLADAQDEYRRISLMLRGLKSAVREVIGEGEVDHEEIRVVLSESESMAQGPISLP
ncbi:MAG: hypothetical protein GY720_10360 [bacterium]|nr:hypothetical protein [bacterium]